MIGRWVKREEENRRLNNARVSASYRLPVGASKIVLEPRPAEGSTAKIIEFVKDARKPRADD